MELKDRRITFSPVFNVGFGYMKTYVGELGEYKFKTKIFLMPFLAIKYIEIYVA